MVRRKPQSSLLLSFAIADPKTSEVAGLQRWNEPLDRADAHGHVNDPQGKYVK